MPQETRINIPEALIKAVQRDVIPLKQQELEGLRLATKKAAGGGDFVDSYFMKIMEESLPLLLAERSKAAIRAQSIMAKWEVQVLSPKTALTPDLAQFVNQVAGSVLPDDIGIKELWSSLVFGDQVPEAWCGSFWKRT